MSVLLPRVVRRHATLLVALIGLAVTLSSWRLASSNERERIEIEFIRRADIRHTLTREVLNYYGAGLFSLRSFYLGNRDVDREEFDRVAREIVARYPGISALEWAPIVPAAQRPAFEAVLSAELGRPIQITESDRGVRFVPAAPRAEYVPVRFVHPAEGREAVFGFDLTGGRLAEAINRARRERRMTVSPAVRLIEKNDLHRTGVVWTWPIFHDEGHAANPAGYVLGVFDIAGMLDESLRRHSVTVLEALYLDPSETEPDRQVLHFQSRASAPSSGTRPTEEEFRRSPFLREQALSVGDQLWRVLYRPQAGWLAEQQTNLPAGVLGSGLALTALLAFYVRLRDHHAENVEGLVARRTAELTESQRQLDNLFHSLPGMAYRGTFDEKFDITFVSEGALALTGHEPAEFLSLRLHLRDLIHPDDLPAVRAATRDGLAHGREVEVAYRIRTREGTEKWVLSRGRAVRAPGAPVIFEGLAMDITAQKRAELDRLALERKLFEGQKLESLGLLAGGIAHDFNNLLTGILGNAGLARLTTPPGSTVVPQLRAIEQASLRAAELCRQMLAYAGKGRFVVEALDVTLLVEGLVPLLETSIARRAALRLDVVRDLPAVMADATELRQIVMNLVLNAADAIGPGHGTIAIVTGRMAAGAEFLAACAAGRDLAPGDYVFLEVGDNGSGMTPDVVARIFDPFFTTKFAGRGLGLAAALGIVRSHHGALHVASAPGAGSRFRLLLPPTPALGALPTAAPPPDAGWRWAGHALVIDDEEPVRLVAAEMLKSLGLTPRVAGDGHAGLAAFREDPMHYDLVLLDLLMPALGGEETLALLRAIQPGVRVVLMSGYSEGDLLRRVGDAHNSVAFLPKPFTRESLIEKLRAVLG